MISVIMTTHDGRKDRCKRAIESVLSQKVSEPFELIVVDDFSQDGTEEMVKSFDGVIYVRMPSNFGNDTRPKNEGIKVANGEYIAFLDSDNEYRPDHLSILFNEIEEYDMVYGDRMVINGENGQNMGLGVTHEYDIPLLMRMNYIDTSDVLIRKKALLDIGGFDEKIKKFVDWNVWVRLAKNGAKIKRVPRVITNYYIWNDAKSFRQEDTIITKDNPQGIPSWKPLECDVVLPYLKREFVPKVAIYSITYNRLELTKECFHSLYTKAGYDFEHYIIDNGSTDGTKDFLRSLSVYGYCKGVFLIENEDNKGISIASNQAVNAIMKKDYDFIGKVDNDAYFRSENWLREFVDLYKGNKRMAMSCYITGLKHNVGGSQRVGYNNLRGKFIGVVSHLGGICVFCDRSAYEDFRWDEKSPLHGIQDVEFSQNLNKKGFFLAYLEEYYCEHFMGTDEQHKMYPDYFAKREQEKVTSYEETKQN